MDSLEKGVQSSIYSCFSEKKSSIAFTRFPKASETHHCRNSGEQGQKGLCPQELNGMKDKQAVIIQTMCPMIEKIRCLRT